MKIDDEMELTGLSENEIKAIASFKRLAKKWPSTLWLYSASGTLNVMKKNEEGDQAMKGDGADSDYIVARIDIENDGGDW